MEAIFSSDHVFFVRLVVRIQNAAPTRTDAEQLAYLRHRTRMLRKLPRPSRRCIFCRDIDALTREHVWADWLKAYIPRDLAKYSALTGTIHQTLSERRVKQWSGDPRSRRLKVVCGRCNNGWMSRLQQRAKPILLPLIRGTSVVLDREAQTTLAAWAAMAVMVAEYLSPDRIAIPAIDRHHLWLMGVPPHEGWKVWIGNFRRRNWKGYWVHNAMAIGEEYVSYAMDGSVAHANTQTTTFVVGQLYIQVFSCTTMPDLVARCNLNAAGAAKLAQIWPVKESAIIWPVNVMMDRDADSVARYVFEYLNQIGQRAGV